MFGCGTLLGPGRASYRRLLLLLRAPCSLVIRREISHVADSSECPYDPGRPRRHCPLGGTNRRLGPALQRQHGNDPEMASAWCRGLLGPFRPAASTALEGDRGRTCRGLRFAPEHELCPG